MWEKINKEERNNKFQRLEQDENRESLDRTIARHWAVTGAALLLVLLALGAWHAARGPARGSWRTAAHVHVHTYEQLARLAPRAPPRSDLVVSCYYNLPGDPSARQLMPDSIHPHLCTHINVAFARVVNKEIALNERDYESLRDIVKLKHYNPDLKILLSVGGSGGDGGFSEMVVNHASRKIFIKSIKAILRNYTLDGIDLDWEFPGLPKIAHGGRERQHFSQLLREIRMEYIRERRDYILTIAAAAPETIVNISYDIDQVNQYVDYVNIMTYDYHFYNKYTPFTGFNSPLYARSTEQLYMATLNINYTVNLYLDKGLERSKIVVGIPTYGHTFALVNANNPRVGAPASGFGTFGGSGYINYPDVCTLLKNYDDVNIRQDNEAKVPYLYRHTDWVSYDTPQSVTEKAKFIKENNFRGAMIYALNADDYAGICNTSPEGTTRFPLTESIKSTLFFNNTELY